MTNSTLPPDGPTSQTSKWIHLMLTMDIGHVCIVVAKPNCMDWHRQQPESQTTPEHTWVSWTRAWTAKRAHHSLRVHYSHRTCTVQRCTHLQWMLSWCGACTHLAKCCLLSASGLWARGRPCVNALSMNILLLYLMIPHVLYTCGCGTRALAINLWAYNTRSYQ